MQGTLNVPTWRALVLSWSSMPPVPISVVHFQASSADVALDPKDLLELDEGSHLFFFFYDVRDNASRPS